MALARMRGLHVAKASPQLSPRLPVCGRLREISSRIASRQTIGESQTFQSGQSASVVSGAGMLVVLGGV
jgi:hypothetical protein